MAVQKMLHGLRDGELHIHHAAVAKHHDKKAQPPHGRTYCNGAKRAPVDLGALARGTNQFRVAIDTNRYSVPAEYASRALIAKLSPEWICIYHDDRLIPRKWIRALAQAIRWRG